MGDIAAEATWRQLVDAALASFGRLDVMVQNAAQSFVKRAVEFSQEEWDRGLAVTLKRDEETDEQAFERVKNSTYLIDFKHDEYWPFYHVDHKFGRIILTINTAHAFFDKLYNPLKDLARKPVEDALEEGQALETKHVDEGPLVALELLLLSLARAQGVLGMRSDEAKHVFDQLRREWSETYRIQLTA